MSTFRLIPGVPLEVLVQDERIPCPYLEGEVARLPMRLPVRPLSATELDERLIKGDRRQGPLLYRPACDTCVACEAIRLDVNRFRPNRSQRRAYRYGEELLRTTIGPTRIDDRRLALFDAHRHGRGLAIGPEVTVPEQYGFGLAHSCCESFELRYDLEGELVAVAVTDRSAEALSAVYCYYNPAHQNLSLGTYSVMKHVELCRQWGLQYLYLGLYVADCRPMKYKAGYLPHERLVGGRWIEFGR